MVCYRFLVSCILAQILYFLNLFLTLNKIDLFVYFGMCWVFTAALAFLRLGRPWGQLSQLQAPSTGSVLRCSELHGIFLDQGLNPRLLHRLVILYHWTPRETLGPLFCLHSHHTCHLLALG